MEAVDVHLCAFPSLSAAQGPQVLKTATSLPNSPDAQQSWSGGNSNTQNGQLRNHPELRQSHRN